MRRPRGAIGLATRQRTTTSTRAYHHGDLKTALVEAGFRLARSGGPGALGLREVTRAVGVTPNAAYRHFADRAALMIAVAARAQAEVAEAMRTRMAETDESGDPAARSVARLRGIGLAYVAFAREEPGLFQLAFHTHENFVDEPDEEDAAPPPFALLTSTLDELVSTGALTAERRPNAEWACWSAVHGLADLATRGPLHDQPDDVVTALAGHVVDRIITGVIGG